MGVIAKPYWQDGGLGLDLPHLPLPSRADVLIVGAGYTGLSAARATAAAGADTWVLEAGALGAGCSGRNGGQVAYSIKPSFGALKSRHGESRAFAICQEGREAVAYLRSLATERGVDCDWRVIPIGSYQIATQRLGREAVRALIPNGRNIVDSRRVVVYYRPSADGERIIFGGRAALAERDPLACVPRLHAMLSRIFPQLRAVGIDHAWAGWVAYTFDSLPHLGRHEGIYYCMGYCGQGVPLAPYFGMRVGQQMVGLAQGRTALDELPFPSRPYYFGFPWFLAPSVFAYRTLDAVGM